MAKALARANGGDGDAGSTSTTGLGTGPRVLLATLAAVAGIIHLAMVPSHWSESPIEGVGFAVAGWIQLAIAVLVLVRPTALLLRATVVANFAFVVAWLVSRTWGLPFGDHAWHPHDPSFVDLTCVGAEIALIGVALYALQRPNLGREWSSTQLALGAIVPLSVVALATAALGSPSARNHGLESHGGHSHADTAAATAALASTTATDDHHHAGSATTAKNDKGLSKLVNGHQHASGIVEIDNATQAQLSVQLAQTVKLVERYPNIAAAEAAGWRRAGPFSPGLGTHYTRFSLNGAPDEVIQGVDGPMSPTLIFDGIEPDAPIAGFMYMSYAGGGKEPQGWIGPNDHWHYHDNVCIAYKNGRIEAPLGADDPDVTQEMCSKYGGRLIKNTGYMVHVWTVPGYESSRGVFSEVNPAITCPDGTYHRVGLEEVGFLTSTCKNPTG
jgi:hypothetical protein